LRLQLTTERVAHAAARRRVAHLEAELSCARAALEGERTRAAAIAAAASEPGDPAATELQNLRAALSQAETDRASAVAQVAKLRATLRALA
jgi:hypothetical protein